MYVELMFSNSLTLLNNTQCRVLKLADKPSCLGGGDSDLTSRIDR